MICARFEDGMESVSVPGLFQWDRGQVLIITGLGLPRNVEVHFALTLKSGTAKRRIGHTEGGVTVVGIPDICLTAGQDIYAWAYLSDADSGKTVRWIRLEVRPRAKPERYRNAGEDDPLAGVLESASASEAAAAASAALAESYAHGGTDGRGGEEEDNAMAYALRAEEAALRQPVIKNGLWHTWDADAGEYACTGDIAGINFPRFMLAKGNLYVKNMQGSDLTFRINDDGELEVIYNGCE